ncbi:MAG: YggS family pyridoxal phosphate-dependent enzyme [Nitrospirota bacterium]|nr:YggS family pyridoxal phosphate-dependent enzyme [Nitrospirota bacterium]
MGDLSESDVIVDHVAVIRKRIQDAAVRTGRNPDTIRLIAATKTVPVPRIQAAVDAGITHLGESKLQEALPKLDAFVSRTNLTWHFIGQLQRRKVKAVIGRFQLIHSVDSLELAQEINRRAVEKGLCQSVLLELNIGEESTKTGFSASELVNVLDVLDAMPNLAVKGLMAIPPPGEAPESARPYFRTVRDLAGSLKRSYHRIRMDELSMGMSHDFEIAVEEGATYVRIGTAIFGQRPAKANE